MVTSEMQGRAVYLRTTDENGRATFNQHVCWDVDRFLEARLDEVAKLNQEKKSTKASVQRISKAEFDLRSPR